MATVQTPIAEGDRTPNREIPPMSYPDRIRSAARLAWTTLRTGQHPEATALLNGARAGMNVGINLLAAEIGMSGKAGV